MPGSLFQNSFYVVNNINAILHGVELVLYFMTLRQVVRNRHRTSMDRFLVVFTTIVLVLITIYWTTQAFFGQQMWVVHADYPGGIDAYLEDHAAVWYQTWGSAAVMTSNLMSDALMLYRLYVIWDNRAIVVFPSIIWLSSLACCLALLYYSGSPDGNYFAGIATKFATAWNSLTLSFNVIVTALICSRIVYIGRRLTFADDASRSYVGAVAIMIESALPFTIGSMAYVITYGIGSDIAYAFSCYSMFTAITPQLIALRVLTRRAWRREHSTRYLTSINFSGQTNETATHAGHDAGSAAEKHVDEGLVLPPGSLSRV